jgi:hypothetical protein
MSTNARLNLPFMNSPLCLRLPLMLATSAALVLTGCWTPPNAHVQPAGKPGLIQGGIPVEVIQDQVKIVALDPDKRLITLAHADGTTKSYYLKASVKNLPALKVGDTVKAYVAARVSVYIAQNGEIPDPSGGFRPIRSDAKIQQVDPSYRLVVVEFAGGQVLTIKAGLDVQLEKMAPGDDITVISEEISKIKIEEKED